MSETNTEDTILKYLLQGNHITVNDCQRLFHSTELRHYIARIRKRGYLINSCRKGTIVNGVKIGWHKEYWVDNAPMAYYTEMVL
jgi:hypothetical protein